MADHRRGDVLIELPSKPWSRPCSARSSTDEIGGRHGTQTRDAALKRRRQQLRDAAELKCRQAVKFWGRVGSVIRRSPGPVMRV
jgi:hypothetical protein